MPKSDEPIAHQGAPDLTEAPRSRTSGRVVATVLTLLAALLVATLVRLVWQTTQPHVSARTLSFTVVDDTRTDVRIEVSAPKESTVECQVRAQAADTLDVGSATVILEPAPDRTRQTVVSVPTRRRADTGQAFSCRITG